MPYRCDNCQSVLSENHLLGVSVGTIPNARACDTECAAAWEASRPHKTEWEWKPHSVWVAGFRAGLTNHPFFTQPADAEIIWRYLNFAKLSDLLKSRELYLAAAHNLGDPFEGSLSSRSIDEFEAAASETARQFVGLGSPEAFADLQRRLARNFRGAFEWERQWTYVSCWHVNPLESAGMWSVYGRGDSIAVRSTVGRLRSCLAAHQEPPFGFPLIARVRYLDYSHESVETRYASGALLQKRKEYEHENELRVLLPRFPHLGEPSPEGQHYDERRPPIDGVRLEVDLSTLIEGLVVAPNAAPPFVEHIRSLAKSCALDAEVCLSSLSGRPIF